MTAAPPQRSLQPQGPSTWLLRYMSIPFREHGRDLSGCDCWGLAMLIQRQERGIVVDAPALAYGSTQATDPTIGAYVEAALPAWQAGPIEPFAVLLFEAAGQPAHVGVALDVDRFVHTQAPAGVRVSYLDRREWGALPWRARLLGAYRHVGR